MPLGSQIRKTFLYILFKNYKIISVVLVIIIVGFGGFTVLYPKYQGIQNQGLLDFGNKQKKLEERQSYLNRLEKMVEDFRTINKTDVENLKNLLPESQEIPELFVMLDRLGADIGMKVTRITLSPQSVTRVNEVSSEKSSQSNNQALAAENESTYSKTVQIGSINIIVGLEAESIDYGKFKNMLTTLEKNMRILDINTINYEPGADTYQLNMTTYYLAS